MRWLDKLYVASPGALLAMACIGGTQALAQSYPTKTIRFVVGFGAGGATDTTARMIAQKLTEMLGQPVVVENRAGSGGLIATETVSRAAADGYTLLLMPAADAVQPALRSKLPYNLERDFDPITLVVNGPFVLVVHPSVPAKSVRDLVALARAQPGKLNYASSGVGSSAHIANELFNSMAKVKTEHIPYKGVSEGVTATATGQTDMIFASITSALPLWEANKVKALAVSTIKRSALAPTLPTVDESGLPGYDRSGWYGVIAPAGVPKDVVSKLNAAIAKVANAPEMKTAFNRQGLEPNTMTAEAFGAFIREEIAKNIRVAKEARIPVQ